MVYLNPFRTAVSFWGQATLVPSVLFPKLGSSPLSIEEPRDKGKRYVRKGLRNFSPPFLPPNTDCNKGPVPTPLIRDYGTYRRDLRSRTHYELLIGSLARGLLPTVCEGSSSDEEELCQSEILAAPMFFSTLFMADETWRAPNCWSCRRYRGRNGAPSRKLCVVAREILPRQPAYEYAPPPPRYRCSV